MPTTRLKIAKLTDPTDAAHLEKALEAVPRVTSVEIDPAASSATIQHDGAPEDEFTRATKNLGYLSSIERS